MHALALEVRDHGTFIAVLAVELRPENEGQRYLIRREGYRLDGVRNIIITALGGRGKATNDCYEWGDRTWATAHRYIIENWASLHDGDVVDVAYILGETTAPKVSERIEREDEARAARHQGVIDDGEDRKAELADRRTMDQ